MRFCIHTTETAPEHNRCWMQVMRCLKLNAKMFKHSSRFDVTLFSQNCNIFRGILRYGEDSIPHSRSLAICSTSNCRVVRTCAYWLFPNLVVSKCGLDVLVLCFFSLSSGKPHSTCVNECKIERDTSDEVNWIHYILHVVSHFTFASLLEYTTHFLTMLRKQE